MRGQDVSRFEPEFNKDFVVLEQTIVDQITATPAWNKLKNNPFTSRRRMMGILLRAATKVLVRYRAAKRLKKIKDWVE